MSGFPPKFTLDLIGGGDDIYLIHIYFEQVLIKIASRPVAVGN